MAHSSEKIKEIRKVDANQAPLSAYLGILGMIGLTAYLGLTEIGKPKEGETLLVSGAAGAVGSVVGQIGKILGLRVVGIAGSDEKINLLKSEFGYDEGINYNTIKDMKAAIKEACPNGVDIYFDNVGGEISDAVLFSINKFARMIICGAISVYNETSVPKGVSVQPFLIKNSALMQGFIVSNFQDKFPEAGQQLGQWLAENKTERDLNNANPHGWKINPSIWKKRFRRLRKTQKIKKQEEIRKLNETIALAEDLFKKELLNL